MVECNQGGFFSIIGLDCGITLKLVHEINCAESYSGLAASLYASLLAFPRVAKTVPAEAGPQV